MIPATDCPPATADDTCCRSFWLVADRIRTVAFDAVVTCAHEECDKELGSYVDHGDRTQDPIGNNVVVAINRATVAYPTRGGRQLGLAITRLSLRVELRETGWPMPSGVGGSIKVPAGASYNYASQYVYDHGEAMWRALVNAAGSVQPGVRMFDPQANPHIPHPGVAIGDLLPLRDALVGWMVPVTVDLSLAKLPPVGSV